MHIIWWPISEKRVAGSPAPRRANPAAQRTRVWIALRRKSPLLAKAARNGAPQGVDGFKKRNINLLLRPGRFRPAPIELVRGLGLLRARWEQAPEPFQ